MRVADDLQNAEIKLEKMRIAKEKREMDVAKNRQLTLDEKVFLAKENSTKVEETNKKVKDNLKI